MSLLPVMILLSLLIVVGAGAAFFWAVEHDQFEDLQSPAFLPLLDDDSVGPAEAGRAAGDDQPDPAAAAPR